jgi:hypothetical protein
MKVSNRAQCSWVVTRGPHKGDLCIKNAGKGRDYCSLHIGSTLVKNVKHSNQCAEAEENCERQVTYQTWQEKEAKRTVDKDEASRPAVVLKSSDKIIPFGNPDKDEWEEKPYPGRSLIDFCASWRMSLCGRCSCGKGTVAMNVICRQSVPFERIIVWHCSPENTSEWDEVTEEIVSELPEISDLNTGKKTLLVIDDIDLMGIDKQLRSRVDRLFGFTSSHCNVSVMYLSQDMFRQPASVRKNCNIFMLWKIPDKDSLNTISRRMGMDKERLIKAFKTLETPHDFLCIDLSGNGPELRKNIFEVITV